MTRIQGRSAVRASTGTAFERLEFSPEVLDRLSKLLPKSRRLFASLHGAPKSVAEANIQLLPFGSRASLSALGLVTQGAEVENGYCSLVLTPLAYEVMAAAAAQAGAGTESSWDARMLEATQDVED